MTHTTHMTQCYSQNLLMYEHNIQLFHIESQYILQLYNTRRLFSTIFFRHLCGLKSLMGSTFMYTVLQSLIITPEARGTSILSIPSSMVTTFLRNI